MLSPEQLMAAWQLVRQGSRCAGIDGVTPALFAGIAQVEVDRLSLELAQGSYMPLPALGIWVRFRQSARARLVGVSAIRDRIVQRYLLQQVVPIFERSASEHSYAYRIGRSAVMAVQHFWSYLLGTESWIVQTDIKHFFDCICWAILEVQLGCLELEPEWRDGISQQLSQGIVTQGQCLYRRQGLIQGSALSGALANVYLHEFDRRCALAGMRVVRYGDDLAIACESRELAEQILQQIQIWLEELYLTLQPEKTQIHAPGQKWIFLGHYFQGDKILGTVRDWHPYQRHRHSGTSISKLVPKRLLACSLNKSKVEYSSVPSNHYWSDSMTTLYLTDQGSVLRVSQQRFQVFHEQILRCEVPVHQVESVILFGCCHVNQGAARLAFSRQIPIFFLSQKGRYFGRLSPAGQAEVSYLTLQVQKSLDEDLSLSVAEQIVVAKLTNSRVLLQRLNRRHDQAVTATAIADLASLIDLVPRSESVEMLRGYEGQGAKVYFRGLAALMAEPFQFDARTLRPPKDPVNSLLSLGYTLLHDNLYAFVVGVGLHTHFGHLHTPRNHHPALVMDLTEEFRAQVVDSFVVYLINSKILKLEDFTPPDERGGVYLHPDALRKFLKHWEDKLHTEVTHPHTGYKVPYRRCFELQVREYLAWLTGDRDSYRPMVWGK